MPPDPTPPLPLAANRAALSNRISMLLSSQSSVLKTMNLTRPSPTDAQQQRHRRHALPSDDDDDLLRGSRPNEGVGYVPEAKDSGKTRNTREERLLRGKKGRMEQAVKGKKVESESEDEVGRSALGKRKRPRREVVKDQEEDEGEDVAKIADANMDVVMEAGNTVELEVDHDTPEVKPSKEDDVRNQNDGDESNKKKRKKKNKKKKQKAKQSQEQ